MQHLLFMLFWVAFTLTSTARIAVVFRVDVGELPVGPGGVHIAGEFLQLKSSTILKDWDPGASGSKLTSISPNVYEITILFPESSIDSIMRFQFVRDSVWINENGDVSEGNPGDCCLSTACAFQGSVDAFDRFIQIPSCGGRYYCKWNTCTQLVRNPEPKLNLNIPANKICMGDSIQLLAESEDVISWLADTTLSCLLCPNPIARPDSSRQYIVQADNGNCVRFDTITIQVLEPFLTISKDTILCKGQAVVLQSAANSEVRWLPDQYISCTACPAPKVAPPTDTRYFAEVKIGSCSVRDSVLIRVDSLTLEASGDQSILYGQTANLQATSEYPVQWSTYDSTICKCNNLNISPKISTLYTATATTPLGCSKSETVLVTVVSDCSQLIFPNLLLRKGNTKNESLSLEKLNIPTSCRLVFKTIEIYNRWGQPIFESDNPLFSWPTDVQTQGTFFYRLKFEDRIVNDWLQILEN